MTMRKWAGTTVSILAVGTIMACGNLTPGGLTGRVTLKLSGDADTLSAAQASLPFALAAPFRDSGPAGGAEEAEGEIQVEFQAFLVSEAGGEVRLGRDHLQVQADVRGRTEADVVDRQMIPALRYTELRLVFTKVHAEVEGLIVDGVPVPEVDVELEHLSLLVSRPIELTVEDGDSVELVVDLNALAWLAAVDPLTGTVDETVFGDLVHVVVR